MNKNIDIKNIKSAKKYAQALIEASRDSIDNVYQDLRLIDETIIKNRDFMAFFAHPIIALKDKKETLEASLKDKIEKVTFNFIETLLDENRFLIFPSIFEVFKKQLDVIKNRQLVEVTSAVELKSQQKELLEKKLGQKLNKEIIFDFQKDEKIIAGLIIKIEDKIIDLSLKTKFDKLKLIKNN